MNKEPVDKYELLELYKFHAEIYDRANQRQHNINRLHIGLLTAVLAASVAFIGLSLRFLSEDFPLPGVGLIAAELGALLSFSWWMQLRAHGKSIAAKLAVLRELEERISFDFFSREEKLLRERPYFLTRIAFAEDFLPKIFLMLSTAIMFGILLYGFTNKMNGG